MPVSAGTSTPRPVRIDAADAFLNGDLSLTGDARALVVFAHGSGSSRHSSRNRAVADVLHQAHLATLLLDLLTEQEERIDHVTAEFRFDIPLLSERVVNALDWAESSSEVASLPLGVFGASTGTAAALIAAADRPALVRAVVSRGGRPDLADATLDRVAAPTLLIVGERDDVVIRLNEDACARLTAPKDLRIVAGAGHLFEEPGTLTHVSRLAADWFTRHVVDGC